jgi:hypothetical protein
MYAVWALINPASGTCLAISFMMSGFHEHHQPSIPKALMDCSFQFSKGLRVFDCAGKLDHGRFERARTASNDLDDVTLRRSISTLLMVIILPFYLRELLEAGQPQLTTIEPLDVLNRFMDVP